MSNLYNGVPTKSTQCVCEVCIAGVKTEESSVTWSTNRQSAQRTQIPRDTGRSTTRRSDQPSALPNTQKRRLLRHATHRDSPSHTCNQQPPPSPSQHTRLINKRLGSSVHRPWVVVCLGRAFGEGCASKWRYNFARHECSVCDTTPP